MQRAAPASGIILLQGQTASKMCQTHTIASLSWRNTRRRGSGSSRARVGIEGGLDRSNSGRPSHAPSRIGPMKRGPCPRVVDTAAATSQQLGPRTRCCSRANNAAGGADAIAAQTHFSQSHTSLESSKARAALCHLTPPSRRLRHRPRQRRLDRACLPAPCLRPLTRADASDSVRFIRPLNRVDVMARARMSKLAAFWRVDPRMAGSTPSPTLLFCSPSSAFQAAGSFIALLSSIARCAGPLSPSAR